MTSNTELELMKAMMDLAELTVARYQTVVRRCRQHVPDFNVAMKRACEADLAARKAQR